MTQEEFFKRYTYDVVEDRIGGGGFGTVYKAYDNVLHHDVAIKVAEVKTVASGKTFSLKDEVEALSGLPDHPNIAYYEKEKLYTFKTPTGVCDFAVMQYYPDGNLSNAIKQGLTVEQKEDIATQLLEGIDFLHKHKVVHRDLKPGNILIVKHGGKVIPLITDFGLSKAAGVVDGSVFSNSFGAGTPRYSSPEQLQGNPLRFNTDLWSYGAILYELFTGTQLFTAGSGAANTAQADMEIYNKIVNGNVQSLGKMPEKWRKVAERCLVVDATKRAKDAEELFSIIIGDEDETEVTDGPTVPPVSKPSSDSGRPSPSERGVGGGTQPEPNDNPKTKKGLWIGLGIAVAAVAALLVLLLKPKQGPVPTDPDTQAYEACQTVADYRAYMGDFGRNAKHYYEAKQIIDKHVADSSDKVQELLVGVFSISSNKMVYFASGNLQYKASTNEWRFAPNPWDYIGEANSNISPTYNGWIDLFGWGTGKNPTKTSSNNSDYSCFSDWGNNLSGNWRTLTKDEWKYVFDKRNTKSGIRYAKAKVNGVSGVILLPDDWIKSAYSLNKTNVEDASFESNNISSKTWNSTFAPAGAVFFPTAGSRTGTSTSEFGIYGSCWSATPACHMGFYDYSFGADYEYVRYCGRSVRLVRPAN